MATLKDRFHHDMAHFLTAFHTFSTPPSRTKAFEEFKQEKGSEINRILVENKGKSSPLDHRFADFNFRGRQRPRKIISSLFCENRRVGGKATFL